MGALEPIKAPECAQYLARELSFQTVAVSAQKSEMYIST